MPPPTEEPSVLLGSSTGGDVADVEKVNLGQVAPRPFIAPLPQAQLVPEIQQPQAPPPALPQAKARPILRRLQFPGTTRRRLVR